MKIKQNVKSGFASIKELFGIFLSDDTHSDGYDFYINNKNEDIAKTAQILKSIEQEQESKRMNLYSVKLNKPSKKKVKSETKYEVSPDIISSDSHIIEKKEPER